MKKSIAFNMMRVALLAVVLTGATNCAMEHHLYSVEDAPGTGTATVVNTLDISGWQRFSAGWRKFWGGLFNQGQAGEVSAVFTDQFWECQDDGKALVCYKACGKVGPGEIACRELLRTY